jgi:hypothetical protein
MITQHTMDTPCIETTPQANWVTESQDEEGHPIFYMNVCMTGLWPRRYGPFDSHQAAVLFLDDALDTVLNALLEVDTLAREHMMKGVRTHGRQTA